jgi:hypothetical protein
MTRYRRLPGCRRGFVTGSSVWLGDDHLLLVKSARFREEYKRYHLSDVQAIAVAQAPRFHISTRAATIGCVWLVAMAAASARNATVVSTPAGTSTDYGYSPLLGIVGLLLLIAWLVISGLYSCRCRIYTAVSADELPSVYRTWTARRFLAKVGPKIEQVQGTIDGAWAEAAETRNIGPPEATHVPGALRGAAVDGAAPIETRTRNWVSDLLLAVLFAAGIAAFLTLNWSTKALGWLSIPFLSLKVGLSMTVLVQHYKGKLRGGMQKLAIAVLIVLGLVFYTQQMVAGYQAGATAANKQAGGEVMPVIVSANHFGAKFDGIASLVLGCIGVGMILLERDSRYS